MGTARLAGCAAATAEPASLASCRCLPSPLSHNPAWPHAPSLIHTHTPALGLFGSSSTFSPRLLPSFRPTLYLRRVLSVPIHPVLEAPAHLAQPPDSCSPTTVSCSRSPRPGGTSSHKCKYHGDQYSYLFLIDCDGRFAQSCEIANHPPPRSPPCRSPSLPQIH